MTSYMLPGNFLVQNRYRDLHLPWTGSLDQRVAGFDEARFLRLEWPTDQPFHAPGPHDEEGVSLDIFEKLVATGSAETRWRQANPDLVGTEKDVLRILRRKIENLLQEAGVEPGRETLRGVVDGVILFVKKEV